MSTTTETDMAAEIARLKAEKAELVAIFIEALDAYEDRFGTLSGTLMGPIDHQIEAARAAIAKAGEETL